MISCIVFSLKKRACHKLTPFIVRNDSNLIKRIEQFAIMGIRLFSVHRGIAYLLRLIENGAGIIDLGGESTRPGSDSITAEEELRRITTPEV
jgi:dihydropteroate synthase